LCAEPSSVHAAGVPCSITPVLTEANLNTCIAEAPTDNSEFTVTIGADFNITAQKDIAAGKNITLTSTNPASPATLTRDPGFAGRIFSINIATPSVATFTIDGVILDGNNPTTITSNHLIYASGTGNTIINLTGNTVLRNNNNASNGGAIVVGGPIQLNISGNVQIINNTTIANGGGISCGGAGSALNVSDNVVISNNTGGYGGGINLISGCSFIMNGGTISDNTADVAGGVRAAETFIMSAGEISGNTATRYGGGVSMADGMISLFTMTGGGISGNTAQLGGGGGVMVAADNTFNMSDGIINGNTSGDAGGGVKVNNNGIFNMSGSAEISNNSGQSGGGIGVNSVSGLGVVTVSGGRITGNTAENGGGVYVGSGTANIASGNVVGNTATADGGGVYTEDYDNLTVGASTIFSANRAAFSSPNRDPADDVVYATNILGTNWTTPFTQGYNNYDINHDYAPEAPGTGLFGGQIDGAIASALAMVVGGASIAAIFVGERLLRGGDNAKIIAVGRVV